MLPSLLLSSTFAVASIAAVKTLKLNFDHYSITVEDLDRSAHFYKTILSLPEIENKTEKKTIRWFSMGEHAELHLIQGNTENIKMIQRVHLALATSNLEALIANLEEHDIYFASAYGKPNTYNTRPDGVRQIYFQDPDGYWIEVNDVAAAS
ncbi:VOC family protein [Fodinibius sediminis]|uniref:Catechol 2,3-dioxygenase n=1 Tax=Fodinibius sediminis TaxID=1214077 RepID=A0A521CRQ5_9BACT|nr:VOC family protein [Fodinibius sediminis]SMO62096.1 Catechol 2,3-dioxygenase [Fodinibius sediminis]